VLSFGAAGVPPQDVNIARVTARAALGQERGDVHTSSIEAELSTARPRGLTSLEFTYALFDVGALHCRAQPLCDGCPLTATCASRTRLATGPAPSRHASIRYKGSTRELRGAVLRTMLANPAPTSLNELHTRVATAVAGRDRGEIATVLETLIRERLVSPIAPDR
jgi:adenine-specific DNA glycosylase